MPEQFGGAALLGTQYLASRGKGFTIALDQQRDIISADTPPLLPHVSRSQPIFDQQMVVWKRVFTQNDGGAKTGSSSFPKGYFLKMRDELPDPVSDNCSRETQPSSKKPKTCCRHWNI